MQNFCSFLYYNAACPDYFWLYVANMTIPWQHFVNSYLYKFCLWVLGLYILFSWQIDIVIEHTTVPRNMCNCDWTILNWRKLSPFSFSEKQITEMKMPHFCWIYTFTHIHTVAVYYAEGCYSYLNILLTVNQGEWHKKNHRFQILLSINRACFNNSMDNGINVD